MITWNDMQVIRLLGQARVLIENLHALPELPEMLAGNGYERVIQGEQACQALETLARGLVQQGGEWRAATDAFRTSWQQAGNLYRRHARIAEHLLAAQPELQPCLGLGGPAVHTFDAWLAQARQFYACVLHEPRILAGLEGEWLTVRVLALGKQAVEAAAEADAQQKRLKLAVQRARRARDAAAWTCQAWQNDFWPLLETVLSGQPELLAQITGGIHDR